MVSCFSVTLFYSSLLALTDRQTDRQTDRESNTLASCGLEEPFFQLCNSQIRQNLNLRVRTWNLVQPLNFPFSAFCGMCLLWTSVGRNYQSYRWPYDCMFFFQVVIIFVLVLVQIDLIHFDYTECLSSTSIKTNTYPLHLRSIHTILCKIGHVIQIILDQFVLIQFVLGQFKQKLIQKSLSLSHEHSFTLYPSLSLYSQKESQTEKWIYSLRVGWRNLFSSCAVVLCQFLVLAGNAGTPSTVYSGGLFWDWAGNCFWCYVRT